MTPKGDCLSLCSGASYFDADDVAFVGFDNGAEGGLGRIWGAVHLQNTSPRLDDTIAQARVVGNLAEGARDVLQDSVCLLLDDSYRVGTHSFDQRHGAQTRSGARRLSFGWWVELAVHTVVGCGQGYPTSAAFLGVWKFGFVSADGAGAGSRRPRHDDDCRVARTVRAGIGCDEQIFFPIAIHVSRFSELRVDVVFGQEVSEGENGRSRDRVYPPGPDHGFASVFGGNDETVLAAGDRLEGAPFAVETT